MRAFSLAFSLGAAFAVLFALGTPLLLEAPVRERVLALFDTNKDGRGMLLIGGDVMLSRQVERIMGSEGYAYPFSGIQKLFDAHEYVLINFEGTIPEVHVPTPSMGFSFSVAADIAQSLFERGVTHAGLANNHAFDFGADGYHNARAVLRDAGIHPFGHPHAVGEVVYVELDEVTVGIVPIHAVFTKPDREAVAAAFTDAARDSDFQIAYVHWGVEYELVHDRMQEVMAREWITSGADAIVGHHPHVVQDIARLDGVPVFYSLGNLIFDQYWDGNVRTGLLLSVEEDAGELLFTLIPVFAEEKSVPSLMQGAERQAFLASLAARSGKDVQDEVLTSALSARASILAPSGQ